MDGGFKLVLCGEEFVVWVGVGVVVGCGFGESFCVGVFWWGILVGFGLWGVCIVGR